MKNVCKKAIAMLEVATLTIALMVGITFVGTKEVRAAENELVLNEGVSIISSESEELTFTAPADGTYYFYSQSDDCDTYADLLTETHNYSNDDGYENNYEFLIEAELTEGEICKLVVSAYEEEYTTTIYVRDEVTANESVADISGGKDIFITVGESCELSVEITNVIGNTIAGIPEGYSVKWYKTTMEDEDVYLQRTGLNYNIDEILTSYLYSAVNDYVRYKAVLYNGDIEISHTNFRLIDYNRDVHIYIDDRYANAGEDVVFTVSAYDYDDMKINLAANNKYTYQWYKYVDGECMPIEGATDYRYIFEASENDFNYELGDVTYYICEMYMDGEIIAKNTAFLYDKTTYIDVVCPSVYISDGDDVTVTPEIYDYYGEEIDLYDENLQFQWSKSVRDTEESEIISTEPVLVLENYIFDENIDVEYCLRVIYKNLEFREESVYIDNVDNMYSGTRDIYLGEKGDSLTFDVRVYDHLNEYYKTEFEETFTFEWYKTSYDGNEYVYSDVLGTKSTYGLVLDSSDFYDDNAYTQYECKVYNNGKYVASYMVYIFDVGSYWSVKDDDYYVNIGDKVTFVPIITDYFGDEIDINDERFSYQWYVTDLSEDSEIEIENDSTYTINSITYEDLYDKNGFSKGYEVRIYDSVSEETKTCYFKLHEGERPIINLFEDEDWYTYVGPEWAYCDGIITGDYGIVEGNFVTTGGGWEDAVWGIQAESPLVYVDKGETYVYSAKIISDKDMTMRVKVSGIYDEEFSYETIDVKANEVYDYFVEFKAKDDLVKIVYALGAASEDEIVEDVEFKIYDNCLAVSDGTVESPEEPTVEETTKTPETTKSEVETTSAPKVKKPAKAKIKKTYAKKKASKVAKIQIKKVKNAKGYQIQISKSKKFKGKNILVKKHTKKLKPSFKSKKLKNKKKLYVRVRAYVLDSKGEKVYGKWSKAKKIKIK